MSFLAPYMLLGALAAGIPIALHFFYRSRYRTVPWAAMKFLLASIEQTSRRLRFQELLLLILRVTALLLLAFALSRPSTRVTAGEDSSWLDAVDAVFVIDTSYSMAAKEGPGTRLQLAQTAALSVIDHLPQYSTVQVIACSDKAELLGPRVPSNLEQARTLVQRLTTSHRASDLLPGVREAAAALERGQAPNKELYVFGDMQALGWNQQAEPLSAAVRAIHEHSAVYLVRCGTATPRNATVVGIVPQAGIPHTGERAGFAVLVRNTGAEPVRDLTVQLLVDGRKEEGDTRPIDRMAPGETRVVTLTGKLERSGLRVLTATLRADELEPDNRFDQVILVREQVRVLVVDGSPNERDPEKAGSYFLLHALRPVPEASWNRYHVQPRVVTAAQAQPALLADRDLCILANAAVQSGGGEGGSLDPEFLDRLAEFVREGHGLLIFGGEQVNPDAYNRLLFENLGLLPGRLSEAYNASSPNQTVAHPLRFEPKSATLPAWSAALQEGSLERLGQVELFRTLSVESVEASRDSQVVLRYDDGRAAIVWRRFGEGQVMLVAAAAEPAWGDWPIRPTFVPFVQMALSQLIGGQVQAHNRTVGEPLLWRPATNDVNRAHRVTLPDGRRLRLGQPERIQDRPTVVAAETDHAGIYWFGLEADGGGEMVTTENDAGPETVWALSKRNAPFAVAADLRESESLDTLTDQQLDERLGFQAIHLTAGDDAGVFSGTERLNREWTVWLLAFVLGLVLMEAVLAWLCGRVW